MPHTAPPSPASAKPVDTVRKGLRATRIKAFPQIAAQHWRLPPGLTVDKAVTALSANPNVKFAEPNYIVHKQDMPNDPSFSQLWGLHNTGQTNGTVDAAPATGSCRPGAR